MDYEMKQNFEAAIPIFGEMHKHYRIILFNYHRIIVLSNRFIVYDIIPFPLANIDKQCDNSIVKWRFFQKAAARTAVIAYK